MKNFALVIAFAFLAAVSASAAEVSKTAPATTLEQQTQMPLPLFLGIHQLTPRCYTLDGTSCPAAGATQACTDACSNQLSCTCYNYYGGPYGQTIIGRYWVCDWEC